MKRKLYLYILSNRTLRGVLSIFLVCIGLSGFSATINSTGSGAWESTATWDCACLPVAGDVINIAAGHVVTITSVVNIEGTASTVNLAGELNFPGAIGQLRMGAGSSIVIAEGGSVTYTGPGPGSGARIRIGGSFVWTGGEAPSEGPGTIDDGGFMPVELIYFSVKESQGTIQINWATSLEENFSHFEIEKSTDGVTYEIIGSRDGQGGLDIIAEYSIVDQNPIIGLSHYRLKAVDLDGSHEYFGPRAVEFYGDQRLKVYPNPVVDGRFSVELNFVPQKSVNLYLIDANGRPVIQSEIGSSSKELLLPEGLSAGIYTLIAQNGSRQLVEKVIVK